ncbi:MAG: hypothetical protein KGS48_01750 [Bacteroidetes bacterium]|nr:hypothetical protein [Bacteroidota bacterium]
MIQLPRVLSLLILFSLPVALRAQAVKTFSKSFNTEDKGILRLDLPGAIDVKIWDNPCIRFEINVSLPAGNASMLNELANVGRYNLASKAAPPEDVLIITAPNLQKQVRIKGETMPETVSYTVFVPKNMALELPNAVSLAEKK